MSDFDAFDSGDVITPAPDLSSPQNTLDEADPFADAAPRDDNTTALDDDPFAAAAAEESAANAQADAELSGLSAAAPVVEQKVDEETPLTVWERQRAKELNERREKAEQAKRQQLTTAKEELAKFYADRDAQLEKTKKTNRTEEKNFKQDMKALMEFGSRWEKVNKLVNLQPKPGEKVGQSKVERFRKLLIQLKAVKDADLEHKE